MSENMANSTNDPQLRKMGDQFKYDPQKHVGTIFDPIKGRRVAVTDENMLPKINTPAGGASALQMHQMQLAL